MSLYPHFAEVARSAFRLACALIALPAMIILTINLFTGFLTPQQWLLLYGACVGAIVGHALAYKYKRGGSAP